MLLVAHIHDLASCDVDKVLVCVQHDKAHLALSSVVMLTLQPGLVSIALASELEHIIEISLQSLKSWLATASTVSRRDMAARFVEWEGQCVIVANAAGDGRQKRHKRRRGMHGACAFDFAPWF